MSIMCKFNNFCKVYTVNNEVLLNYICMYVHKLLIISFLHIRNEVAYCKKIFKREDHEHNRKTNYESMNNKQICNLSINLDIIFVVK